MMLLYFIVCLFVFVPSCVILAKLNGVCDITVGELLRLILVSVIPVVNVLVLALMFFDYCKDKFNLSKILDRKIL